jgi:hypothetical protein
MTDNGRRIGINMAHLEVIAKSVIYWNGRDYASSEHNGYDFCAVKRDEGAIAFVVPIGNAPKPEDVEDKKPGEIEEMIRKNRIYAERVYQKQQV